MKQRKDPTPSWADLRAYIDIRRHAKSGRRASRGRGRDAVSVVRRRSARPGPLAPVRGSRDRRLPGKQRIRARKLANKAQR